MSAASDTRAAAGTFLRAGDAAVLALMVLVVGVRLLTLREGPTPDEGGFLAVADQWRAGGRSLYGDYWVDRPPLLVAIFGLAATFGGFVALQVIGALAAACVIGLLASTARRAFGAGAAVGAAVVAAALLVNPFYGARDVNGELLSLPFIALGMRLAVEAALSTHVRTARVSAFGAGVAAVAALLVKQNMADVVVFAAVCWLVAWRRGEHSTRGLFQLVGLAVLGAGAGYAVVMSGAMLHGTSPYEVYEATYPFRIEAGRAIVARGDESTGFRLTRLAGAFVSTGVPLVLAAMLVVGLRRSRASSVAWAVVGTVIYGALSVLAGGSYWLHYLVETVPAVSLAAGAVAAAAPRLLALVATVVVICSVATLVAVTQDPLPISGTTVGRAVAASSLPGDTVVSAFGGGDVIYASGLSSPYPYLWSLPSRVRDPDLTEFRDLLSSPSAPTWLVVRGRATVGRLLDHGATPLIQQRYREVGRVCGRWVYLIRGVDRPPLVGSGSCTGRTLR